MRGGRWRALAIPGPGHRPDRQMMANLTRGVVRDLCREMRAAGQEPGVPGNHVAWSDRYGCDVLNVWVEVR